MDNSQDLKHAYSMTIGLLVFGVLPLIAFAILDSFFSLKAALIGAAILVGLEAILSYSLVGEIDNFTIFNTVALALFAGVAWKLESSKFFKMYPAIMSLGLGTYLLISYLLGQPAMAVFLEKYMDNLKEAATNEPMITKVLDQPHLIPYFNEATFTMGILLFFHAALCAYTAMKKGNLAWVLARLSLWIFLFAGAVWAQILIS